MTDKLRDALAELVHVIDQAGIQNLSNGVQLGPTVWYVKASDAMNSARAALAQPAASGEAPKLEPVAHLWYDQFAGGSLASDKVGRLKVCELTPHCVGSFPVYARPPVAPEPEPLADARIEAMWRNTFSTSNPFCPCDLKSFTKAARATEWAVRAQYAALRAPQPKEQT